ncbi:hypothetical protein [Agarivorans sp. Z349TD_8]|uniref:hypothetical protein n=1 Tax=Agarivorans sp. Z349TD_8 TaxID=3421434 RepID=UPI003D7C74CB
MKQALLAALLFISFSSLAFEEVIFNGYKFPVSSDWSSVRLMEDDNGFYIIEQGTVVLIVKQHDKFQSPLTLEDGTKTSVLEVQLDRLHGVTKESKSAIYKGLYASFSPSKVFKGSDIDFFLEVNGAVEGMHFAFISPDTKSPIMDISTSVITEAEFITYLKSITVH